MDVVEVFADVACPFTYVGVHRLIKYREQLNKTRTRSCGSGPGRSNSSTACLWPARRWPRRSRRSVSVAPDLFAGFPETRFPVNEPAPGHGGRRAAAYRQGLEVGERFSVAVRRALFEDGLDISNERVLRDLRLLLGVPHPSETDRCSVEADLAEGERRGVAGSPHFFTAAGDFFCPSLDIERGPRRLRGDL